MQNLLGGEPSRNIEGGRRAGKLAGSTQPSKDGPQLQNSVRDLSQSSKSQISKESGERERESEVAPAPKMGRTGRSSKAAAGEVALDTYPAALSFTPVPSPGPARAR